MIFRKSTTLSLSIGCLALALTACGKSGEAPGAQAPGASTAPAAVSKAKASPATADQADALWDKKAQAYIRMNNSLTGFNSSMTSVHAKWAAQAEEKVKNGDFKSIRGGLTHFDDSFVKNVKEALDNPAPMPEVDAAAKALLDVTQQYLPNWKSLEEYNKAKRYEDDNGAEGKRMLPMYREGIEKINAALAEFSARVDVVARESTARVTAKYKANGQLMELNKMEALAAARSIADTFSSAKDFKDKDKIEKANAQLVVMEAKLVDMKAEHAKRKAESPDSLPRMDRYESVYSELTSFAGKYREARKNPEKFNDAIKGFNKAVDASNMMAR